MNDLFRVYIDQAAKLLENISLEWKTNSKSVKLKHGFEQSQSFWGEQLWQVLSMHPLRVRAVPGPCPFSEVFFWSLGISPIFLGLFITVWSKNCSINNLWWRSSRECWLGCVGGCSLSQQWVIASTLGFYWWTSNAVEEWTMCSNSVPPCLWHYSEITLVWTAVGIVLNQDQLIFTCVDENTVTCLLVLCDK